MGVMRIPVLNPETEHYEKSYLANPYSAGVTTVVVKNANRFAANQRIMLGEMGAENAEIVTVSAVNADNITLTIGATLYPHSTNEPVTVMVFDQVRYYRSTDGGATYSVLTTVNLDVDNADLETVHDDTTGLISYYYKFTFYHSVSTLESGDSDVIKGSGWRRRQAGYIIDEFLQEVSDPQEQHVTRGEVIGWFGDVNDDLTTNVSKPYSFLHTRTALTRTANRNYIDFPTDANGDQTMWKFDRMDYNFTDTDTDPDTDNTSTIKVFPPEEFRNLYTDNTISSTTVSDDKPVAMTLDTSVNRFRFSHPAETTAANVFYLHYWQHFPVIDSEGDVIITPTGRIYKLYFKGMYYRKRGIDSPAYNAVADRYFADYLVEKGKYKGVDRKDKGTPRAFRPLSRTVKGYRR
jgi:hypothetical protein